MKRAITSPTRQQAVAPSFPCWLEMLGELQRQCVAFLDPLTRRALSVASKEMRDLVREFLRELAQKKYHTFVAAARLYAGHAPLDVDIFARLAFDLSGESADLLMDAVKTPAFCAISMYSEFLAWFALDIKKDRGDFTASMVCVVKKEISVSLAAAATRGQTHWDIGPYLSELGRRYGLYASTVVMDKWIAFAGESKPCSVLDFIPFVFTLGAFRHFSVKRGEADKLAKCRLFTAFPAMDGAYRRAWKTAASDEDRIDVTAWMFFSVGSWMKSRLPTPEEAPMTWKRCAAFLPLFDGHEEYWFCWEKCLLGNPARMFAFIGKSDYDSLNANMPNALDVQLAAQSKAIASYRSTRTSAAYFGSLQSPEWTRIAYCAPDSFLMVILVEPMVKQAYDTRSHYLDAKPISRRMVQRIIYGLPTAVLYRGLADLFSLIMYAFRDNPTRFAASSVDFKQHIPVRDNGVPQSPAFIQTVQMIHDAWMKLLDA